MKNRHHYAIGPQNTRVFTEVMSVCLWHVYCAQTATAINVGFSDYIAHHSVAQTTFGFWHGKIFLWGQ